MFVSTEQHLVTQGTSCFTRKTNGTTPVCNTETKQNEKPSKPKIPTELGTFDKPEERITKVSMKDDSDAKLNHTFTRGPCKQQMLKHCLNVALSKIQLCMLQIRHYQYTNPYSKYNSRVLIQRTSRP